MDGVNVGKYYPNTNEIDSWVDSIWEWANSAECKNEVLTNNGFTPSLGVYHNLDEFRYVKFSPQGMEEFYGYWQPVMSGPAPLLVHTPGYGAGISTHPDIVSLGYNVLHISPLGYTTPNGQMESKKKDSDWPVFKDTIMSHGEKGYKQWLMNCILAVKWAMMQSSVLKERVSFFGTSQGGGGSLLLGSIFKDKGVRCVAADVPFLTNIPLENKLRTQPLPCSLDLDSIGEQGWRALGYVDTISHAHRLNCPVLLTVGEKDDKCPADSIKSLFELLPGTRSYNFFKNLEHRYSREFIYLISSWFRMYS